jgi:2-polyprenyl-6-hydroxyphenyl methylase/3-demethylubiquinone-9 3-methyltransferase
MIQEPPEVTEHQAEVASGQRFAFGKNWASFLKTVDDQRIEQAKKSLTAMLDAIDLRGKSFLDVGCGSGLFSLAARLLGATVHSLDYDASSVQCARELKRRYLPDDLNWTIEEGSVLDQAYLTPLGCFDVVYSWGVLHHTGNMWIALENVSNLVASEGRLFIAIYNDQGSRSVRWRFVKKLYNRLPRLLRFLIIVPFACVLLWRPVVKGIVRGYPFEFFRDYKKRRGMSVWHDILDWLGGLPFEVAKPEEIFDFYKARNFALERLTTDRGSGCNEFLFVRKHGELPR